MIIVEELWIMDFKDLAEIGLPSLNFLIKYLYFMCRIIAIYVIIPLIGKLPVLFNIDYNKRILDLLFRIQII